MYGAFARLNYKPWFAIAEFVDNSIQSFISNKDGLAQLGQASITVRIFADQDRIVVTDDAAGIGVGDFPRAFLPAEPPPQREGLSEFGLGMKAAACWFAKRWSVRTQAAGDPWERTIRFDVPKIIANQTEELTVEIKPATTPAAHFTTLTLEHLNVRPQKRTTSKIKTHLASIYRCFLRTKELRLFYNDEELSFSDAPILVAPRYDQPDGPPVPWKADFVVDLDGNHTVRGWAALREKASLSEAGFSVFRRNRLVLGSHEEAYRPEALFRKPNSYIYQRLFGELHVDGFDVSHTKDGLQWDEWEDLIIAAIKDQINKEHLPLLDQAELLRVRKAKGVTDGWGEDAVTGTAAAIERRVPHVVEAQMSAEPISTRPDELLPAARLNASKTVALSLKEGSSVWEIAVELANDPALSDWYSFSFKPPTQGGASYRVQIRVNLAHPFSERFALSDADNIEPLLRLAAGIAISELTALQAGVSPSVRTLRHNLNQLLREALAES